MTAFWSWARQARSYPKLSALAASMMLVAACGSAPPLSPSSPSRATDDPAAKGNDSPFAGLKPCSADDTSGTSCAKQGAPRTADSDTKTLWNVPVGPDDPVLGPADALVTVVVFSDFECPFCKRTSADLAHLLEDFGKSDLRLVWKDCPSSMHMSAMPAAQFARAIRASRGDSGFWIAHDRLYASQGELGEALFQKIAKELNVPWLPIHAAIANAQYGVPIHDDLTLADRVAVDATPTTFINGRKLVGAQSYGTLKDLADRELANAKKIADAGTPRGKIYEAIVAKGKQVSPPSDTH